MIDRKYEQKLCFPRPLLNILKPLPNKLRALTVILRQRVLFPVLDIRRPGKLPFWNGIRIRHRRHWVRLCSWGRFWLFVWSFSRSGFPRSFWVQNLEQDPPVQNQTQNCASFFLWHSFSKVQMDSVPFLFQTLLITNKFNKFKEKF